jgi:hypothetical protein
MKLRLLMLVVCVMIPLVGCNQTKESTNPENKPEQVKTKESATSDNNKEQAKTPETNKVVEKTPDSNTNPVNNNSTPTTPEKSANTTPGDWVSYSSEGGKYSVKFPQKPKESGVKEDKQQGVKTEEAGYLDQAKQRIFVVNYLAIAPEKLAKEKTKPTADQLLDNMQKSIVASLPGTLKDEKKIDQNGIPGKEFTITLTNGGSTKTRIFVNPKNYQAYRILVATKDGKLDFPEMQTFFDSLVIKN